VQLTLEKCEFQFRAFSVSQCFAKFRRAKCGFVRIVCDSLAKMIYVRRDYFSQDKTATARLLDGTGFYRL
jgi:hypothetical protein